MVIIIAINTLISVIIIIFRNNIDSVVIFTWSGSKMKNALKKLLAHLVHAVWVECPTKCGDITFTTHFLVPFYPLI